MDAFIPLLTQRGSLHNACIWPSLFFLATILLKKIQLVETINMQISRAA